MLILHLAALPDGHTLGEAILGSFAQSDPPFAVWLRERMDSLRANPARFDDSALWESQSLVHNRFWDIAERQHLYPVNRVAQKVAGDGETSAPLPVPLTPGLYRAPG